MNLPDIPCKCGHPYDDHSDNVGCHKLVRPAAGIYCECQCFEANVPVGSQALDRIATAMEKIAKILELDYDHRRSNSL